jgi:DNA helicase-2/ATP-dependent DNA helicase PcrA
MGFVPNDRQRQAIEHVHGPMLVVAGAGTGKTTVLARRIAFLIANGHARPDEILAVTYTDAAALHLKNTVATTLREAGIRADASGLHASTFHAHCNKLLKEAGREFGVVDDKDLWILLRRRLDRLPLKHYLPARDPGEFLDALRQFFSRCQDELVDSARYRKYVEELRAGQHPLPRVAPAKQDAALTPDEKLERCAEIAAVFAEVEAILIAGKLGTYGDMITGAVRLLREDAAARANAQEHARFILIDEFQDANVAQIELARRLAGEERNVFAVGDPDQAIYRFRGASSAAFEEFLGRFPGAKGVVLNENQRSTSHILGCAHTIIRLNPEVDRSLAPGVDFRRVPLISAREERARQAGKPLAPQPVSIVLGDKNQEATDIAEEIHSLVNRGGASSIAVIYRLHSHAAEVAYELATRGVPTVVKGINALETPEGRDLLAALGAVASLSNVEDIFRVSALPMFGLDAGEVARHLHESGRKNSYPTLLAKIAGGERVMKKIEAARAYAASVEWQAVPVSKYVAREFGFASGAGPASRICDFITKWRDKAITEKGTLEEFIEYVDYYQQAGGKLDLSPDNGEDGDEAPVQLMTVHSAKGLEFDHVFVLRANTRSFPSGYKETIFEFPQALREMPVADDSKDLHNQEERRLFYVALTRAQNFLSIYAKPSTSKKKAPPPPPGLLRELMLDAAAKGAWVKRNARPATVSRIAAAVAPQSGVAVWMLAKPTAIVDDPVLSATAIEAYDICPLKFKLSREWVLPGPASAALLYGNVMHTVLRDIHQAEQAGRARTEGQVLQLFQQEMENARFDDRLQARLYQEQGARQLTEYFRLRNQRVKLPVLQVEQDFKVKIAGVMVRGRMDRVDDSAGHRRIVDFKTGKAYDQDKADKSMQLGIYALAAREIWGAAPQELVIYNLEDNSEVVSTRAAGDLAELEEKVQEIAAGIRASLAAGVFAADPGFHCRWCDFRNVCPATEQRLYSIPHAAPGN